jgi:DNA mismatch repair protein MutL
MPRIQQLPAPLVNQIAAGEVIERPASVLKELLENAVDAGSSRIDIEVERGGADLIRVADNGCGIPAEDLPLAFASHATSKLHSADDLFRIATLGFRGAALASVGSIAQVTLQSRPPDQPCGAEVTCHGGQLSPVRPWNGGAGTRVEVRHLFYNTPARRKFLRAPGTEMAHIAEAFTRLALAPLTPHVTLRHNGQLLHEVPLSADLLDRVALFFGPEVRDRLYPVDGQRGPALLHGYVADPACERGTGQLQYLFVNGRCVRDRGLSLALQEAYRGLLMTGRYAVAFLFLELPPDQVDVNVHPSKAEVRFRDPQALQQLLLEAVRLRLRAQNLTAPLRPPAAAKGGPSPAPSRERQRRSPAADPGPPRGPEGALFRTAGAGPAAPRPSPVARRGADSPPQVPAARAEAADRAAPGMPPAGPPKAIQVHDLYLVVEVPEGLLVIDQQALHERILFEQLQRRLAAGTLEVQRLLIPQPVSLPARQAALVLEQREALAALGLEVGDFGGATVLLSSYPVLLGKSPPEGILRAVADDLANRERVPSREQLLHELLSLMACHAAVRAGDRLTPEEIAALVAQRDLAENTHHCPHGRPTSLLFTRQDLARQFRRV